LAHYSLYYDNKPIANFATLKVLRAYCIKVGNIDPRFCKVYLCSENLANIIVKKSRYAYRNKYYDLQKTKDGTGFYYVWEWEKKTPFEQNPLPLKGGYTTAGAAYVVDVAPKKKTFWQKIKDYFNQPAVNSGP